MGHFSEMNFSQVLAALKKGHKARFPFWSEDVIIAIQKPNTLSKMSQPYIYVTSKYGIFPWMPTQIELLSDKWIIISEEPTNV